MKKHLFLSLIFSFPLFTRAFNLYKTTGCVSPEQSIYIPLFYFLCVAMVFIIIYAFSALLKSPRGKRVGRVGIKIVLLCALVFTAITSSFNLFAGSSCGDDFDPIPGVVGFN